MEYTGYSGHTLCIPILNGIHRVFPTRAEPVKNPWKTRANLCYFPGFFMGVREFRLVKTYLVFLTFFEARRPLRQIRITDQIR